MPRRLAAAVIGAALLLTPTLTEAARIEFKDLAAERATSQRLCGVVGDTSDSPISAVFDWVNDNPVAAATVRIGEAELDSVLFNETALGFLELSYWGQTGHPLDNGWVDEICLNLELEDGTPKAATLEVATLGMKGYPTFHGSAVGLTSRRMPESAEFALVHDAILGFAFSAFPIDQMPNLGLLFYLAQDQPLTIMAAFSGGLEDGKLTIGMGALACVVIDAVGDTPGSASLTLHRAGDDQPLTFHQGAGAEWSTPTVHAGPDPLPVSINVYGGREGAFRLSGASPEEVGGCAVPSDDSDDESPDSGGGGMPNTSVGT